MSLVNYLKIAWRWSWLAVISLALAATGSYTYSIQQDKVFIAKSVLLVGANILNSANPDPNVIRQSQTLTELYGGVATQPHISEAVLERYQEIELEVSHLIEMIDTEVNREVQILNIFVRDGNPERAAFLANGVAEELIRQGPGNNREQQERDEFIRAQLDDLERKINNVDEQLLRNENTVAEASSAVERNEALTRIQEFETIKTGYQNSYASLLAQLSDTAINQLELIERATPVYTPVAPNIRNNTIMGGILGLVFAVVVVVLMEFLDDTLVWLNDGKPVVGLPVLGAIQKMDSHIQLVDQDTLWSPETNSLRKLRDTILLRYDQGDLQTLLFTSSAPNEGKSFMASNIAVTFATAGLPSVDDEGLAKEVILIDGDLRKPSLHEKFDLPNVVGLTDVLEAPDSAMELILQQAIRPTYIDNLYLLPTGRVLQDPGSLLNSRQFRKMIEYLSQRVKIIVIDSAPVLEAVETKAIDNVVDSTVLVVRSGRTGQRKVQLAVDYFKSKRHNNLLGIAFNQVTGVAKEVYGSSYGPQKSADYLYADEEPRRWWHALPFVTKKRSLARAGIYTLAETATQLGVQEETVRRWCETGRLGAMKTGNSWKIRAEDMDEYVTLYKLTKTGVDKVLTPPSISQPTGSVNGTHHQSEPALSGLPVSVRDKQVVTDV